MPHLTFGHHRRESRGSFRNDDEYYDGGRNAGYYRGGQSDRNYRRGESHSYGHSFYSSYSRDSEIGVNNGGFKVQVSNLAPGVSWQVSFDSADGTQRSILNTGGRRTTRDSTELLSGLMQVGSQAGRLEPGNPKPFGRVEWTNRGPASSSSRAEKGVAML